MVKSSNSKKTNDSVEVKDVVCDYGVYENNEIALICNSQKNALLIKAILDKDKLCYKNSSDYVFNNEDMRTFEQKESSDKSSESIYIVNAREVTSIFDMETILTKKYKRSEVLNVTMESRTKFSRLIKIVDNKTNWCIYGIEVIDNGKYSAEVYYELEEAKEHQNIEFGLI